MSLQHKLFDILQVYPKRKRTETEPITPSVPRNQIGEPSVDGFEWVTSIVPSFNPMITLRNPSDEWMRRLFERFKGTMTQKLMVNPQYKDADISGISDDDRFKEYIYLNGIFF